MSTKLPTLQVVIQDNVINRSCINTVVVCALTTNRTRAQEAKARQVSYLTVDASPMSRPILEKFGFEMIAYSYPCKWKLKSYH
jgi:hypothetical protein